MPGLSISSAPGSCAGGALYRIATIQFRGENRVRRLMEFVYFDLFA